MPSRSVAATTRKKPGKREVKALETRSALFSAAATVVGKHGYEGASIARITELAGVANGTFYNYFETRQDLFDQLLPAEGERLLDYIRENVDRNASGVELERQRMASSFAFFAENPGFLRVLNEAEVYAPNAFREHVRKFASVYEKGLRKQMENGELRSFSEAELKTIVYILMGARSYLMMQASYSDETFDEEKASGFLSTYVKLLEGGLFAATGSKTDSSDN